MSNFSDDDRSILASIFNTTDHDEGEEPAPGGFSVRHASLTAEAKIVLGEANANGVGEDGELIVSDEALLAEAMLLATRTFKTTVDKVEAAVEGNHGPYSIWHHQKGALGRVRESASVLMDGSLTDKLLEVEEADEEFDLVGKDGLTTYWAGEREFDENSPELMGYQFMKLVTRMSAEEPEPEDVLVPKLNDKDKEFTLRQHYQFLRTKRYNNLLRAAMKAVRQHNTRELHKLNTRLYELRDSTFNHRILETLKPLTVDEFVRKHRLMQMENLAIRFTAKGAVRPLVLAIPKGTPKVMTKAERRTAYLNDERTRTIFEDGRCLTYQQCDELSKFFKQAWAYFKGNGRVVEPTYKLAEPEPKRVLDIDSIHTELCVELWKEQEVDIHAEIIRACMKLDGDALVAADRKLSAHCARIGR